MSVQDFDAALKAPDEDSTHKRLQQLACSSVPQSTSLQATAEAYLRAFCARDSSLIRRRWIGMTLKRMMESSAPVVAHLKGLTLDLPRLGEVILEPKEAEDTRTVGGLIIRQGLESDFAFRLFWPSPKVPDNAPIFPREAGPQWLASFQQFLDHLSGLHLFTTNPTVDPAILYPVALVASDGYKWRDPTDAVPLVFVQSELITIMLPRPSLQDIDFVDIPLLHIQSMQCQPAVLYDSQERETNPKPWNLVLTLATSPHAYRLNSVERYGTSFTIMFRHIGDAQECMEVIQCFLRTLRPPHVYSTTYLDFSELEREEATEEHTGPYAECNRKGTDPDNNGVTNDRSSVAARARAVADRARNPAASSQLDGCPTQILTLEGTSSLSEGLGNTSTPHPAPLNQDALAEVGHNGRSDHSISTTTQKKAIQKRPGALPTVKKPTRMANNSKTVFDDSDTEIFEVPQQLPGPERSTQSRRKLGSRNVGSTLVAFQGAAGPVKRLHSLKRETGSQTMQLCDAEDEDDPLSSQLPRPSPSRHCQSPNRGNFLAFVAGKPSTLPAVSKLLDKCTNRTANSTSDVFALPRHDESTTQSRARRKTARSVVYRHGNTSEEESSGSEYVESKPRKSRSPAKVGQALKLATSKKARPLERSTKTAGERSSPFKAEIPHVSEPRTSLIRSMQAQSQSTHATKPRAKGTVQNPRRALQNKENMSPSGHLSVRATSATAEDRILRSEVRILDRLNKVAYDNNVFDRMQVENPGTQSQNASRKRPTKEASPSTPPAKRARNGTPEATEAGETLSPLVQSPQTIAPARVLEEPSSPCGRMKQALPGQTRDLSYDLPGLLEHGSEPELRLESPLQDQRAAVCSPSQPEERTTPVHSQGRRSNSRGSVSQRLLSSNSKVLPASPWAESRAISGHADRDRVEVEREIGEYETAKSDPFQHRNTCADSSAFVRRLTGEMPPPKMPEPKATESQIGGTQDMPMELDGGDSSWDRAEDNKTLANMPKHLSSLPEPASRASTVAVEIKVKRPGDASCIRGSEPPKGPSSTKDPRTPRAESKGTTRNRSPPLVKEKQQRVSFALGGVGMGMEGDTLLDHEVEEQELPTGRASPVNLTSSPPSLGPPSSHSSTSAEDEPHTEPPVPSSEADEIEWEASLNPHQRALQEQLLRVSKRIMRHIVDNETAVEDIADTFAKDGQHQIRQLIVRHREESEALFRDMDFKKSKVLKASEQLLNRLANNRQQYLN